MKFIKLFIIFIFSIILISSCISERMRYKKSTNYLNKYFYEDVYPKIDSSYREHRKLMVFDSSYNYDQYDPFYRNLEWKKNKYLKTKLHKDWYTIKELTQYSTYDSFHKNPGYVIVQSWMKGDSLRAEILSVIDFFYARSENRSFIGDQYKFIFVFRKNKIDTILDGWYYYNKR